MLGEFYLRINMNIIISTTFGASGYAEYGYKVIDTFVQFWPKTTTLYVYYDTVPPTGWKTTADNVVYVELNIPDLNAFKERHKHNPKQRGNGTNKDFLRDGIRFSHKVFAYAEASMNRGADISVWLDGDVITHSPVKVEDITGWLNGKMAGALFRPWMYTETGFHIFDMKHKQARFFFEQWLEYYNKDKIWNLPWAEGTKLGYTDCHTYDAVRAKMPGVLWNNLSPKFKHHHPFVNGVLGKWMDHTKGARKNVGHSRITDIVKEANRTEAYWKTIT